MARDLPHCGQNPLIGYSPCGNLFVNHTMAESGKIVIAGFSTESKHRVPRLFAAFMRPP
jgi:hypothetical protein